MPKYFLKIIIFLLVLSFTSCHRSDEKDQWHVSLNGLPSQVSAENVSRGISYYTIKQTHEPLFRFADGENYTSKILKSWSRNIEYTRFTFCPDTSKRFNENKFFTLDFFEKYIYKTTKSYYRNFVVTRNGDCFNIKFKKSNRGYLDFLASHANAPTIKKNKNMEEGLGRFSVAEILKDKIILKRKKKIRNGYNTIIVHDNSAWDKHEFKNKGSVDFNRLASQEQPSWLKQSARYLSFENVQLQVNMLVINHPDKEVRKALCNCMDVESLRQAFFPTKKDFFNIKTFLPVGMLGGKSGKPTQACRELKKFPKIKKPIIFYNYKENNKKQLEAFAVDFFKKTGIKIKIVHSDATKLLKVLYSHPKPYNLVIVKAGAILPAYEPFFEYFIAKYGFCDYGNSTIRPLYDKLSNANRVDKTIIALKIGEEIKKEFLGLPLSQNIKTFYYPKGIKNLDVGKGFSEYPEVANLRW